MGIYDDIQGDPGFRVKLPTTSLWDIPTGKTFTGEHGESITNGGLGQINVIIGPGNAFKSTFTQSLEGLASGNMRQFILDKKTGAIDIKEVIRNMYHGTELTEELGRMSAIISKQSGYDGDLAIDGYLKYIPQSKIPAEKMLTLIKSLRDENKNVKKADKYKTPFIDHYGKEVWVPPPYIITEDSFTKLRTSAILDKYDGSVIGSGDQNALAMHEAKFKGEYINEINAAASVAGLYFVLTGHVTKEIKLDPYATTITFNQYLNDIKASNMSKDMLYMASSVMYIRGISDEKHRDTKAVLYPRNSDENESSAASDLKRLRGHFVRSKSSGNGLIYEYIVSQTDGLLSHLSQYDMMRRYKTGLHDNWKIDIYPINVQRTTIRAAIERDAMLRRAIEISSDLIQYRYIDVGNASLYPSPKELMDNLIAQGYNWEEILNTRSNWTFNNDKQVTPYLSTLDLVNMYHKNYVPYWK